MKNGKVNITAGLLFMAEVLLGAPPIFVLVGAVAMVLAVARLGLAVAQMDAAGS